MALNPQNWNEDHKNNHSIIFQSILTPKFGLNYPHMQYFFAGIALKFQFWYFWLKHDPNECSKKMLKLQIMTTQIGLLEVHWGGGVEGGVCVKSN